MPVTVEEKYESRNSSAGADPSVELVYVIKGTDDDLLAKSELDSAAPASYDGLPKRGLRIERIGDAGWEGTVHYGREDASPSQPTGGSTFSFDTGGGSQRITQSLATISAHAPAGETAPDFKGAVGVTRDSVEGVDITVPVYQFAETHYIADGDVDAAYKGVLFALTGAVNNATFKGFAAGECLFLGASGSKRSSEDWEITFRFAASPNVTGLVIGDITGIDKRGWEYLWVRYEDVKDDSADALVKRPLAAYVEQVYKVGDFSALEIGA